MDLAATDLMRSNKTVEGSVMCFMQGISFTTLYPGLVDSTIERILTQIQVSSVQLMLVFHSIYPHGILMDAYHKELDTNSSIGKPTI